MRISEWSSDVCSSDLHAALRVAALQDRHLLLLIIPGLGEEDVGDESLRVAVVERELARLDLHHDPVPRLEHVIHRRQAEFIALRDARGDGGRVREAVAIAAAEDVLRSEEHTSELQSLMRSSYAVFCLKK